MELPTSFGLWLKQRRRSLNLTQADLARCVSCSTATIRKIEADERRPSQQMAELLADCLEIPLAERPIFLKVARADLRIEQLGEISLVPQPWPEAGSSAPLPLRPSTPRSNLPAPLTPLLGREHELVEITRLLQNSPCRLLSLIGPGGIGKTRLAIEVASRQRQAFADGVYFVSLAPLSSSEFITPAITDALGFTFYDPTEPQVQLLNYLREKSMLLVLDNFEHLLPPALSSAEGEMRGGVELLVDLLQQAAGVKLLVTSRELLHLQGEWVFEIQGLPVPPIEELAELESYSAAALFLQNAQRAQLGFALKAQEREAVARLCRLVEGMPLGLELAATWVRSLSCTEIVQEIERNLDFLATSRHDMPARHRSIRAVFDHSWKLLSADEQRALGQLSVFPGSFQRLAAEQVAYTSLKILSLLVDKSLLKHTPAGRYEIHELLRQFCQEKLRQAAGEEKQARTRHCHYYAQFLNEREEELKGANEKKALEEIEAEIDNIRAGWHWAVMRQQREEIGGYLESLGTFYAIRGWCQEGLEAFGRAVQVLRETEPEPEKSLLLAKVLARQGGMFILAGHMGGVGLVPMRQAGSYKQLGPYERAREALEESLVIARQSESQREMANVYQILGDLATFCGELSEAESLHQEGLRLYRTIEDPYGLIIALTQLGWINLKQGKLEAAASYLQESLALCLEIGLRRKMVLVHMDLGDLALGQGAYQEAIQHYQESLTISRELNYTNGLAISLSGLARLLGDLGAYPEARLCYQEALVAYKAWGSARGISRSFAMLGHLAILLGEQSEAEAYLRESWAVYRRLGDEGGGWWYNCIQGELAFSQGAYSQAEQHFQQSLTRLEAAGDISVPWGPAWLRNGLGKTACALGAYQMSREQFDKALRSAIAVHSIPEALDILVGIATLLAKEGEKEEATELLAHVLHHPASRKITQDRATPPQAQLLAELPAAVAAAAQARGQAKTFDVIVAETLEQIGYFAPYVEE